MKEFERRIKTYLQERGWDKVKPSNFAKSIMIEGAELLEVFQFDNPSRQEVLNDPKKMEVIQRELADVMIYWNIKKDHRKQADRE